MSFKNMFNLRETSFIRMCFNQLVSTYLERIEKKKFRIIKLALIMRIKNENFCFIDERKTSKNRMLQR